jgi:hypothetical protein
MDAKSIIRTYIKQFRPLTQMEFDWFRSQPTLRDAIENAALAKDQCGKKYSHQWRIPRAVLEKAKTILASQEQGINQVASFDDLYSLINTLLESLDGIGELYVYDTALRMGAYLGHFPKKVYLHAGTRQGAIALGFGRKNALEMFELPDAFQQLEPFEVEDILCIFKNKLSKVNYGDAKK